MYNTGWLHLKCSIKCVVSAIATKTQILLESSFGSSCLSGWLIWLLLTETSRFVAFIQGNGAIFSRTAMKNPPVFWSWGKTRLQCSKCRSDTLDGGNKEGHM